MEVKTVRCENYRGYVIVVKKYYTNSMIPFYPDMNHYNTWYCGYAKIPENHVAYGEDYEEFGVCIDVHGGLTFSGTLRDVDGYFFGFDCAHYDDDPSIQDEEYTLNECKKLVDQLIELDRKWCNEQAH